MRRHVAFALLLGSPLLTGACEMLERASSRGIEGEIQVPSTVTAALGPATPPLGPATPPLGPATPPLGPATPPLGPATPPAHEDLYATRADAQRSPSVASQREEPTAEAKHSRQRRKPKFQRHTAGKSVQVVTEAMAREADPFASPQDCLELLRNGQRAIRAANTARIASWNVRWFPDGIPGSTSLASHATDVEWLACALSWLHVDAVALAEIKPRIRSQPAIDRLVEKLDELTGGAHVVHIDDCPNQNGQHVAWLIDSKRVTVADWQTHAALNPNGDACSGQLRPGLGVAMRFPGGLDLHAIAVHLKSGVEPRDLALRRTSYDGLARVIGSIIERSGDSDVLVAGDFNSMGCRSCEFVTRSAAEASWLDSRLRAYRPEARRVPSDLGCSLYYQRQPSLLDHFVVTSAMAEVDREQRAEVHGHCRELGCEAYSGKEPPAVSHLSDHCPIVLTLQDRDLD